MTLYLLFEAASGYALFQSMEMEDIGQNSTEYQNSLRDLSRVKEILRLKSFLPFPDPAVALENINSISEGVLPDFLRNFLELNLPEKKKKKAKVQLGVADEKLGGIINDQLSVTCLKNKVVFELMRAIRLHFHDLITGLKKTDSFKAQLSLGHSYSRSKVKFNVNREDNMIIQSISLLDTLDKDINTFAMRVKEWYSWHFPELAKLVADNIMYSKLVRVIKDKAKINEEGRLEEIQQVCLDEDLAANIVEAANHSMGTDISDFDMLNISAFADKVFKLAKYREGLQEYLAGRMQAVAPNLSSLIGDQVGARLISHAGSLVNLAKYPASTVQILGAEKALFRALKTRGNTPKYGLIFHSTFIGRASSKNKGRISRYLANKCSIASRMDAFSETPCNTYGEKLREQVEERLLFYDKGVVPRKNIDVMQEASEMVKAEQGNGEAASSPSKKRKRKSAGMDVDEAEKKEKKEKKGKKDDSSDKKGKKKKRKRKKRRKSSS